MKHDLKHTACPFCDSSQTKIYDQEGDWKIEQCKNCNFIYTNPQPTPESLPNYYQEDYFKDKRHKSKFYNEDGSIKTQVESYANRIVDIENHVHKRGRLLEVGSERGGFLQVMKTRGWEVEGVEISADASAIANDAGIETFNGILNDFTPKQQFDSICMYQTLEHVPDPKQTIAKAYELLNANGTFVVEVPNIKCFEQKFSKKRKHLSYDLPRHLNHFAPEYLAKEFSKIGFQTVLIELYPPKTLIKVINWMNRVKRKSKPENEIKSDNKISNVEIQEIPLAKKTINLKTKIIAQLSKLFPGWRFTIIGIK